MAGIARGLQPGGVCIGSIPAPGNFILDGAVRLPDGSLEIRNDPFGLRNGYRIMDAASPDALPDLLQPHFDDCRIAELMDDYYGLRVFVYGFACRKVAPGENRT